MRTAYKCRAYPIPEQQAVLNRTFRCVRLVRNKTLSWRHRRWYGERPSTNVPPANAHLTRLTQGPDLAFLNEVSSVPLQQVLRHARTDFPHTTSTRLVRDHDVVVIEDLNVTGMVRNPRLARAISDCGWGAFRAMLAYKARTWGKHLVVIDRWHPSSKTCSHCRYLLAELKLSARHWTCPGCGTRHDRDINAAKNILAAGLAVSACGDDVRHAESTRVRSPVKRETRPARGGIPRR